MAVPASFNDIAADAAVRDYFGDVWYQTDGLGAAGLARPADRAALRVGHAPGDGLGQRNRGRLARGRLHPFEADITDHVSAGRGGAHHRVVNNTLNWQSIPPGVIEDTPAGKRQRYWHDFFNYAGIHRTVWLYATTVAHLDRHHGDDRSRR